MKVGFQNITGYLYFVQIENTGPIKVGFSKNVRQRMTHLQTSVPYALNLLYFSPASVADEMEYHAILSDDRIRGEWFWPTEKVRRNLMERVKIDERDGWSMEIANPAEDFIDQRLTSNYWENK
jgi:hypothetical protein